MSGFGIGGVAVSGTTEYVSGDDYWLGGMSAGGFAEIANGSLVTGRPSVEGGVDAAVPDGSGGWFISSAFLSVGGVPRSIAHIDSNGNLVSSFAPQNDSSATALVLSGSTLYAAGWCITGTNDANCTTLAAFDSTTGAVEWTASVAGSMRGGPAIFALAVSGSTLYVGGRFDAVDGTARDDLAALDASTGALTDWAPTATLTSPTFTGYTADVTAVTVSGSAVYVGGTFDTVNGSTTRNGLAAFDPTTGTATAWDPDLSNSFPAPGTASRLIVDGSTVYAAGDFDTVNGSISRPGLAAFDGTTGNATDWNPDIIGLVGAIALSGSSLYAGGANLASAASLADGSVRNRIVALDTSTGAATNVSPEVGGDVGTLGVIGSDVFIGGNFNAVGGSPTTGVASIDLATGQTQTLNERGVGQLAVSASIGCVRDSSGGLTAFDPTTGVTLWTASTDGEIDAVLISGSTVYIGGSFTTVTTGEGTSASRTDLAAFDLSGSLAAWAPTVGDGSVKALASSGSTVYAGGTFDSAGGEPRNNLAAFDSSTGSVTPWNPDVASSFGAAEVQALAILGSTVYAGGNFDTVNGSKERDYAAAFDATSGTAVAWNPRANGSVDAIAAAGRWVYMAGGGSALAAYDPVAGLSTNWSPSFGLFSPDAIAASTSYITVVGEDPPYNEAFAVTAGTAPTLTSFSPTSGSAGSTVTLTGSGFSNVDGVAFNGMPAGSFTVVSPTTITAVVPEGATAGPVTVVTDDGSATSNSSFGVSNPAPQISGFSPAAGTRGTTVTVSGSGFQGATAVAFNGSASGSVSVDSDSQITATVPDSATTGPISVTAPGGTATSATPFTVILPPSISTITPSSGGVRSTVTIVGTNLGHATGVTLNGANTAFTVTSSTKITFTVPATAVSGSATVSVTTPGGTAEGGPFTVLPPPAITSFNPGNGAVGETVTIIGSNLDHTVGVEIGHVLTVPTSATSTQVVFTIPPGAVSGPITILATNGSATSADTFTVTS